MYAAEGEWCECWIRPEHVQEFEDLAAAQDVQVWYLRAGRLVVALAEGEVVGNEIPDIIWEGAEGPDRLAALVAAGATCEPPPAGYGGGTDLSADPGGLLFGSGAPMMIFTDPTAGPAEFFEGR